MFQVSIFKILSVFVIVVLLVGNVFLARQYVSVKNELQVIHKEKSAGETNEKILDFARFFIEKVLRAKGEVDFETRLQLETAVRNIGDEEIFSQWQKFTNSQTEPEAQTAVTDLLDLLVSKIRVNK